MYAEALKPITDTMRKFPGVWDLPDAAGADKIKRLTIEVRTALNLTCLLYTSDAADEL